MAQNVFANSEVIRGFGTSYVWIRINAESIPEGAAVQSKFHSLSYPYTVIVEPAEELYVGIRGYRDPETFVEEVNSSARDLHALIGLRQRVGSSRASLQDRLRLAEAYEQHGFFERAADVYAALRRDPHLKDGDECLFQLATSRASAGEEQKALEAISEFEQRFPNSQLRPDAEALRGEIWFRSAHNSKEGEKLLSLWLTRYPKHRLAAHVFSLLHAM